MRILSPYGKDSARELHTIYGFASPQDAERVIVQHLHDQYGFHTVTLDTLHIAYGLTAKLVADGVAYYLKFASRSMHARPEQLFPWLAYVRQHGVLVPDILRTQAGQWFVSPFPTSDYDVVYLMRALPGSPMQVVRESAVQQYAARWRSFTSLEHAMACRSWVAMRPGPANGPTVSSCGRIFVPHHLYRRQW
jgi:hypothetical protein